MGQPQNINGTVRQKFFFLSAQSSVMARGINGVANISQGGSSCHLIDTKEAKLGFQASELVESEEQAVCQKDWKSRLRREKRYNFSQIFGPQLRRVVR